MKNLLNPPTFMLPSFLNMSLTVVSGTSDLIYCAFWTLCISLKYCRFKNTNPSFLQVRRKDNWEVNAYNIGNFPTCSLHLQISPVRCFKKAESSKEPKFFLIACIQVCIKTNADPRRGTWLHINSPHHFIFNGWLLLLITKLSVGI